MASIIDPQLATSLIQEYQTQNSTAAGPAIMTPDGKYLNGFFIDRQSLEAILTSNPQIVGISLNLAKHPDFIGSKENIFTIVFAGAEPNNAQNPVTPYISSGDIYDFVQPCPPYCSNL